MKPLPLALISFSGLTLAACVDARQSYDDFGDRIIDAAARPDARGVDTIPDVTGQFYLVIRPAPTPSLPFQYIADVELEFGPGDDGATISLTMIHLDRDTREPVGDSQTAADVQVSASGEFTAEFPDVVVPARANAATGQQLLADVTLVGELRTEDLFCGIANGAVKSPIQLSLDDSTFGAIRITPGTTGDDLPEMLGECPTSSDADAGVPDAGPADAGLDAGGLDAAGLDAAASDAGTDA
jgi:hypothetical protein